MDKINFLKGLDANLPNNLDKDTFYHTTDTNRFFVGDEEMQKSAFDSISSSSTLSAATSITDAIGKIDTKLEKIDVLPSFRTINGSAITGDTQDLTISSKTYSGSDSIDITNDVISLKTKFRTINGSAVTGDTSDITISAKTYEAGDNISISGDNNTISVTGLPTSFRSINGSAITGDTQDITISSKTYSGSDSIDITNDVISVKTPYRTINGSAITGDTSDITISSNTYYGSPNIEISTDNVISLSSAITDSIEKKQDEKITWYGSDEHLTTVLSGINQTAAGKANIIVVDGALPTSGLFPNSQYWVTTKDGTVLTSGRYIYVTDANSAATHVGTSEIDLSTYVKKADVVNNLTSTTTDAPLSAYQGKVLNEKMLPLSGGTMTGAINGLVGDYSVAALKSSDNTKYLQVLGGTEVTAGAVLRLFGSGETTTPGSFAIMARTPSALKTLSGDTGGTLSWDGSEVLTAKKLSGVTITAASGWSVLWNLSRMLTSDLVYLNFMLKSTATKAVGTSNVATVSVSNLHGGLAVMSWESTAAYHSRVDDSVIQLQNAASLPVNTYMVFTGIATIAEVS